MSKTAVYFGNRRASLCSVSELNEIPNTRSRSSSVGSGFYFENDVSLCTPSPYENSTPCFPYESMNHFSNDSPIMIVTGTSPSVLESPKLKKTTVTRTLKVSLTVFIFVLIILLVIGALGIILAKILPRSYAYCFGEHFCIPARPKDAFTPIHPRQIRLETGSWANEERRKYLARSIPTVVGKLEAPNTEPENFIESPVLFNTLSDDNFIEKLREANRVKVSRSRFMPREEDGDIYSHRTSQWKQWEDQWDTRPIIAPPGVNPRVYYRQEL